MRHKGPGQALPGPASCWHRNWHGGEGGEAPQGSASPSAAPLPWRAKQWAFRRNLSGLVLEDAFRPPWTGDLGRRHSCCHVGEHLEAACRLPWCPWPESPLFLPRPLCWKLSGAVSCGPRRLLTCYFWSYHSHLHCIFNLPSLAFLYFLPQILCRPMLRSSALGLLASHLLSTQNHDGFAIWAFLVDAFEWDDAFWIWEGSIGLSSFLLTSYRLWKLFRTLSQWSYGHFSV